MAETASSEEGGGPAYVGFWLRVVAALIDSLLISFLIYPLLYALVGAERLAAGQVDGLTGLLLNFVLPAVAVIAFWVYRSATPGKMVVGARIVDARTLGKPSTGQLVGRYLGYYVSTIPLGLGLLWVAFDARKQGWHDKLAGTVVIKARRD